MRIGISILVLIALQGPPQPAQAALDQTVAGYCAAWSEPDVAKRRALLAKVWAPGGTYTDPNTHVEGIDALSGAIDAFHKQFPGVRIVVTSQVDYHHGAARFSWRMIESSGNTRIEGMDYAEFAPDGRITKIVGFFGPFRGAGR